MVVAIFNFSFRFATLSSNQPLIRLHFSRVSQSDGLIIICFVDIDECAKNTHKCGANSYCNNTNGGYNCTCHPGYYGDGTNCEPGEMAGFVSTWKIFEKVCKQTILLNRSVPKVQFTWPLFHDG